MDHELSEIEMNEVRLHLANCPHCRTQLSRYKKATDLLLDMPQVSPSVGFDTRFQEKLGATGTTTVSGKALVEPIRSWHDMGRRLVTMLFSAWRPYVIGAAAMGILALFIFKNTGGALTPEEMFLAKNLEILQEYEILSDLDLFEYWDVVENGNSES